MEGAPAAAPRVLGKTLSGALRAYYFGPHHPMKLRLYWRLRKLTRYARLTVPYGDGGWITVDERDVVAGTLFTEGSYEPEVWEALAAQARGDEVLWDVGANIGAVTIRALLDRRFAAVHAFEPDPNNAAILRYNVALNDAGRCTVHELALDSAPAVRELHLAPIANRGLSSLAVATSTRTAHRVRCESADDLVFAGSVPAPTLMKVDVEDWEAHVLRGARRLLAERPPRAIVVEAPYSPDGGAPEPEPVALLRAAGYRVERISRPDGTVETRENFLATREP